MPRIKYRRVHPRHTKSTTKDVVVRNGSEGPSYDPYSYTEYYYKGVTLHLGSLSTWLKKSVYNDYGIQFTYETIEAHDLIKDEDRNNDRAWWHVDQILIKRFERHAGATISAVDKYQNSLEPDPMGRLEDYE